jgi:hypothetical protein
MDSAVNIVQKGGLLGRWVQLNPTFGSKESGLARDFSFLIVDSVNIQRTDRKGLLLS